MSAFTKSLDDVRRRFMALVEQTRNAKALGHGEEAQKELSRIPNLLRDVETPADFKAINEALDRAAQSLEVKP